MTSPADLNALALEAACCAFDPSDWGAMGHNDCPVCDSYRKHTRGKMTAAITAYLSALTAATPRGDDRAAMLAAAPTIDDLLSAEQKP